MAGQIEQDAELSDFMGKAADTSKKYSLTLSQTTGIAVASRFLSSLLMWEDLRMRV